jgi:diacylglycerol kinase family enzyme
VTPDLTVAVEDALRATGELETVLTERPLHAAEIAEAVSRGDAERIYIFSGDGGYNEVVNGLEADLPVGFIPGGSTSVFPRALGLPRDPVAAARALAVSPAERRISLGRVNGRRFAFAAGIGLPADVVRRVDALGRGGDGRRPSDLAFAWAIVRELAQRRGRIEPQLEIEGYGRAGAAFVANGSPYTYAGPVSLPIARDAEFDRGLDLVAPIEVAPLALPSVAARVLSGHAHDRRFIREHDLDRIEIRCDVPLPLHVDGEDLGDVEQAVFEAERAAVSVLI